MYSKQFLECDNITLPKSKYGIDYSLESLSISSFKNFNINISDGISKSSNKKSNSSSSSSSRRRRSINRFPLRVRNSMNIGSFGGSGGGGGGIVVGEGKENIHPGRQNHHHHHAVATTSIIVKKRPTCKSPFENTLQKLSNIIQRKEYPEGTALLYIREIFEPKDPEFNYIDGNINVIQLTKEQVNRLKIMIIPKRREEYLVAYLEYYESINNEAHIIHSTSSSSSFTKKSNDVQRHFDGFKRRYSTTQSIQEKFDLIFAFTFAIQIYGNFWMYRRERRLYRAKMVAGLARHWRSLLRKYNPEQLGLDNEFSFPAVLCFLQTFKEQVETLKLDYGESEIKFEYEANYHVDESARFLDDGSVSSGSRAST